MEKKYVIRFGETLLGRKNTEIIEELFEVAKWCKRYYKTSTFRQ